MEGILEGKMPLVKSPLSASDIRRIFEIAPVSTRHAAGGVSGLDLQKNPALVNANGFYALP